MVQKCISGPASRSPDDGGLANAPRAVAGLPHARPICDARLEPARRNRRRHGAAARHALLIARDEYPQLDAAQYDATVQAHADHLRAQVDTIEPWPRENGRDQSPLFDELGYAAIAITTTTPATLINEVFDRRRGNRFPRIVQLEVSRRLGLPWTACLFPAISWCAAGRDGVLVRIRSTADGRSTKTNCAQRARPHLNGEAPDDRALFQILNPASHPADPDARAAQPAWRVCRTR